MRFLERVSGLRLQVSGCRASVPCLIRPGLKGLRDCDGIAGFELDVLLHMLPGCVFFEVESKTDFLALLFPLRDNFDLLGWTIL